MSVKYITNLDKIPNLTEEERTTLKQVNDKFVFRLNDYYLGLIDWSNPNDPIRKLVIPSSSELQEYGHWDSPDEDTNFRAYRQFWATSNHQTCTR